MPAFKNIPYQELKQLVLAILAAYDIKAEVADAVAEVLIAADMRGVVSHGVAHLKRHLADIEEGLTQKNIEPKVERDFGAIAKLDAQHGLGAYVSKQAMDLAIKKAAQFGIGAVSVANSCHHGMTGYYAMMALEHDMIGMAFTNTAALVVPTNGLEARLGTNPIAFAAPTLQAVPFVLDMSTSVVTRGSLEIRARNGQPIPEGWAVDGDGNSPQDVIKFLDDLLQFKGGLLPLGGQGLLYGGHKGYSLAVMVDILSSLLAGGPFGIDVKDTKETAACVNHFFIALSIEAFNDVVQFKTDMDSMLQTLLQTKPIAGVEQVAYAGYVAHQQALETKNSGVPVLEEVLADLNHMALKLNLQPLK